MSNEIEIDLPFERLPMCGCDSGVGPAPTKMKIMECRLRGGPCSPGYHNKNPEANRPTDTGSVT